jgi:transposase
LFNARGFWGGQTGPNPTDRAKLGSKRHLICDGRGVPLAIQLTRANRNDSQQALALVDAIPFLQGERGRPRHRPDCVLGDRGYDAEAIRQGLRGRNIVAWLAKRNTDHGSGLGRWRWVVERTFGCERNGLGSNLLSFFWALTSRARRAALSFRGSLRLTR